MEQVVLQQCSASRRPPVPTSGYSSFMIFETGQQSFVMVTYVPISVIRFDNGASWPPHKQTRLSPKELANNG